jgi:hypothetical protein
MKDMDYKIFEDYVREQEGRELCEKEKEAIDDLRERGFSDEHIMGLFND